MISTGRESLGEISPEGLLLTQNPTGSVSALPVSLPAGTRRGGVKTTTQTKTATSAGATEPTMTTKNRYYNENNAHCTLNVQKTILGIFVSFDISPAKITFP